jgi:hypothetical protein
MRAHTQRLILGVSALAGFVIVCIALSMTLQPLAGQRVYPILPTQPATTTITIPATTTATPTTTTTVATTTVFNTTTPAPYVALNVSCPPDATIALGSSLSPNAVGYATATATSVESCGAPVTYYRDGGVLDGDYRKRADAEPLQGAAELRWDETQQGVLQLGARNAGAPREPISLRAYERSPTFAQNNVDPQYGNYLNINGLGVLRPDGNGASSSAQTISAFSYSAGSIYLVSDPGLVTVWLAFSAATSFGSGVCATPSPWGEATVTWDNAAQRWLITERAAAANALCLYLSSSADALAPWQGYVFNLAAGITPSYVQLGIWPLAYTLSLNASNAPNLCVLDRVALLGGDPAPALVCGESISGPLSGFTALQSWTPLSVEGDALLPDSATASAGTNSVAGLWMRQHDDELHDAASTPTADWLDIEHWTSINFTLATWIPLRYVITVDDFDSSFAACESEIACIPLPGGTQADPVRQVIMHRLVFRNQQAWGSFVSNANGVDVAHVRWFQLVWAKPTPTASAQWLLAQEGNTRTDDGIHRWLSSVAVDSQGTAVLGYNGANATLPAQMMAASRLANDPLNGLRSDALIAPGLMELVYGYPNNTQWGSFASISTLPGTARSFFFHGQVQSSIIQMYAFLLRIRGETITRLWTAEDLCSNVSCTQIIVAV